MSQNAGHTPPPTGKLIVISGPSGAGKTTLLKRMYAQCEGPLEASVSATTRRPRPGEVDGTDYHFLTPEEVRRRRETGDFLECFEVYGRGDWYGTLRSEIEGRMKLGIPVILVIEVEGAGNIKKMYPGATTIFVLPPDMQELERRLRCRGTEDEETIQRRLKRAEAESANSVNYDEHVVNIEVDSCAESLYSIIQFKLQHGSDE